ncbi:MAG TPA: S49 family peptidase [Steroidobacteraceae bacterium]|jgi:signal peptide peptidase SppA
MRHALLVSEFLSTPWAVEHSRLAVFAGVVARWAHGVPRTMEEYDDPSEIQARRDAAQRQANTLGGGVARIPIFGAITQRASMMSDWSGGTSTQQVSQQLADALSDDSVGSILLDIDSPGGSVMGIQELADEIRAAGAKKPVAAIANSMAASAAYWLASQASEFYLTPSGMVGSIGVYVAHEDYSKALDEIGIKTTLVSAGKFKTEGNDVEPLSDEAKAHMQATVDAYYQAFTGAVARGRGVPVAEVRGGMGQGRMLTADEAKAAKMVDGVQTYAQTVKLMQRRNAAPAAARARARSLALLEQS